MSLENDGSFDLAKTYAYLEDGGEAPLVMSAERFWKEMMSGSPQSPDVVRVARGDGWLVGKYQMIEDTRTWEMHPLGDELLVMLSGRMDLILEQEGKESVVELPAGKACLVPRGTWHRQVARAAGDYLGATYGKGTQHRPR